MWYFDEDGIMINGSLKENLNNVVKHFEFLEKENKKLREIVKALEADKMNDERVKELTERVEYLELNGWCLSPEEHEEWTLEVEKFKQKHPGVNFEIIWECGSCSLGDVMTCFVIYHKNGERHKVDIYVTCH